MATPVHLISGFLGAGKTTAIRAQLDARRDERVAVIVNDFGEASLDEAALEARVHALGERLAARRFSSVVVTNEVGMGIVPEHPLGRRFRDVAGRAHQHLGALADEVVFSVLGQRLRLKPAPVVMVD